MLINQATALQILFTRLAERGMTCTGLAQFEADMRLALRAQAQSRSTLEALAEIKNPCQVAFVKQANISQGHQQVNNGVQTDDTLAHENNPIQSGAGYELLSDTNVSSLTSRLIRQWKPWDLTIDVSERHQKYSTHHSIR